MVADYIPEGEGDIDDLCMEIPMDIPVVNLEHANAVMHAAVASCLPMPLRCL